ncbi:DegT/DnrJ/EryC1/StrS aminotransferase family protein [bacterium]|nr:DegT/DnrJ/EryC1/StrS aminotransferase family protein [bacterium]
MIARATVYHSLWFDLKYYAETFRPSCVKESTDPDDESVKKFEDEFASYMGRDYASAFPLARTALYFALKSQAFAPGDEIIMPPITIKPMLDIVTALGLKPVFVDLEPDTFCFDPILLSQAITKKTKAIFITYLFGLVPNASKLVKICRENNLFIVEDFSQALNATLENRKLGAFGDVGIYSSSVTKTLDTYGGGLAVTDDAALADYLRIASRELPTPALSELRKTMRTCLIWNFAMRRIPFTLVVSPLLTVVGRLSPTVAAKLMGARSNLKRDVELPKSYFKRYLPIQARAGRELLKTVKPNDQRRIQNAEELRVALARGKWPTTAELEGSQCVYWQCIVFVNEKQTFVKKMKRAGFDTGSTNLTLISALDLYPECKSNCKNATKVKHNAMFLPANPRVTKRAVRKLATLLSPDGSK